MFGSFIPSKKKKKAVDEFADTSQPWDRLPNETDDSYNAFVAYRQAGFSRSREKVAVRMYGNNASKHLYIIEEWSELYEWDKRATAYDIYVREHENEIKDKHIRDAEMRMAEALGDVTDIGIDIALGKKKANKDQVKMIDSIFDRAGPSKQKPAANTTNILNQIEVSSPDLPKDVSEQYNVENAEFEDVTSEAESLIPDHLQKKRMIGKVTEDKK